MIDVILPALNDTASMPVAHGAPLRIGTSKVTGTRFASMVTSIAGMLAGTAR